LLANQETQLLVIERPHGPVKRWIGFRRGARGRGTVEMLGASTIKTKQAEHPHYSQAAFDLQCVSVNESEMEAQKRLSAV